MESDDRHNYSEMHSKNIYSQDDHEECSIFLTNALNNIGFSEKNRMAMSDTSCIRETLSQISSSLRNSVHCIVKVGSLAEGATQVGMNSDEDMVMLMPIMYVYKDIQQRAYCQMDTHLIILKDPITLPGYTKLQIVKNRKIVDSDKKSHNFREQEFIYEKLTKDLVGRSVLSNILIKLTELKIDERNGPAETVLQNNSSCMNTDYVRAYNCGFIPDIAIPWFYRIYSNWPSINIRDMLSNLGCFVVPVGCPSSAERELEWRFSFSLQEKYIMLNLNPTQYKCYMILKLIKKYVLEPRAGKCISSYHCKTVLFHTIENTDESIWNEKYLIDCLTMCLKMMKQFVKDGFCQNYFIPEENMFIGKLNLENQHRLNNELEKLISDIKDIHKMIKYVGEDLAFHNSTNILSLAVNIHAEFERVSKRASLEPCLVYIFGYRKPPLDLISIDGYNINDFSSKIDTPIHVLGKRIVLKQFQIAIEYMNVVREFLESKLDKGNYLAMPLTLRYIYLSLQCLPAIDGSHWSKLALSSKPFINTDYEKKLILQALALASSQIHTEIASLISSMSLTNEFQNLHSEMMVSYDKGKGVNYFTNRLKLATFYYKQTQYGKCINMFKQLYPVQYATLFKCACNSRTHYRRSYYTVIPPNGSIETILSIATNEICCCVKFDIFELEAAILPLFYEAFRSFATPTGSRFDVGDYWFDRAVFDPVIYLNFMQINCAYQSGDRSDVAKALNDIEQTIVSHLPDRDLAHLETALNILGHCYLCKGWERLALQCYKVSWNIRPQHNAAKWHVTFLMFGNSYE